MPPREFVPVCTLDDLPDPGRLLVEVEDHLVVVIRAGGSVYCLDDVCTHDGGPLADGELEKETLACPRHGAKFDIRTGAPLSMPATEPTRVHKAKIEGDTIFVQLCP